MKNIHFLFFILILNSCSSDNDQLDLNINPGQIWIESIDFIGKQVTIDWNDVTDADNDVLEYKLYINSILITETTQSVSISSLEYNNEYEGRIIATDNKGGVSELEFNFNSPSSKILVFSDSGGNIFAYDLITNSIIWSSYHSTNLHAFNSHDNLIFTGTEGINGLNIHSGEVVWSIVPSNNPYYNSYGNIITDDSNLYTFDADAKLYCIDIQTKDILWERSFLVHNAPLSIDDSRVYVSSNNDDHLYAINKTTGQTDWSFRVNNSYKIITNPLIHNDRIYFGDYHGYFYALNKNTGEKIWESTHGTTVSFSASPTIFENTVITGNYNTVSSFYISNGANKWMYDPNGTISSSPYIHNNKVYIGVDKNSSGELVCLNAQDGTLNWKFDVSNKVTSSPIVFEDMVYFGAWDKYFYAINANSGSLEWKMLTTQIITSSPTIIVGNSESVIYPSLHGLKN